MKQKIRFQGLLWPFRNIQTFDLNISSLLKTKGKHFLKENYIAVIIFLIGIIVLAISISSFAQEKPRYQKLNIGDALPDISINSIINYGKPGIKTSDLKGKVVIIDFWSTWCGSCIEALPDMEKLQEKFGDRVAILPVTYQKKAEILNFIQHNKFLKGHKITSVVDDQVLSQLFPHAMLPHEVWIDTNGKVLAFTDVQYVNEKNISAILNGEKVSFSEKDDMLNYDGNTPLIQLNQNITAFEKGNIKLSYSAVSPYLPGIPSAYGVKDDSIQQTRRTYIINFPIVRVYLLAFGKLLTLPDNRIILEVKDPAMYHFDKAKSYLAEWSKTGVVCYESVLPFGISDSLRIRMLTQDMNKYLNLNGRMEKRRLKCLVMSRADTTSGLLKTNGRIGRRNTLHSNEPIKQLRYAHLDNIIWELNDVPGSLPAVDETNFSSEVDMDLKISSFANLDEVRAAIKPYGLTLQEASRELEVFVLSEATHQ